MVSPAITPEILIDRIALCLKKRYSMNKTKMAFSIKQTETRRSESMLPVLSSFMLPTVKKTVRHGQRCGFQSIERHVVVECNPSICSSFGSYRPETAA